MNDKRSEVEDKADFQIIRYAQCWEDADVLLDGLDIQEGEHCLSIASAGDNSLAMLAKKPAKLIALDLNPLQLACLELRVAAYRNLEHAELLELMGSRPSDQRKRLYEKCRPLLKPDTRAFWDGRLPAVERLGLGGVGKFERYFRIFRTYVLPLVHSRRRVQQMLRTAGPEQRRQFYDRHWNSWRWRLLINLFFSQTVMGRLGRDPAFFTYAEDSFSRHVAGKAEHAICELEPGRNPYMQWIFTGTHGEALPYALRAEHFDAIRNNLDKLEWQTMPVEAYVERCRTDGLTIDRFNLSNIFEYMSGSGYSRLLSELISVSRPGSRLLYWNMLVPRSCPDELRQRLKSLDELSADLHCRDKAFFYRRLVIEEVL
jgi:S-adenosylmethionine-diacylglycerol 3-amino-3-carboxypropyl transferase